MAKRKDVGTSDHTPVKHALMRAYAEREVRAANQISHFDRLIWLDLTAGNAVPSYEGNWHDCCSPGILAHHASQSTRKPVWVGLHERDPKTYATLLENLATELPRLGYERNGDASWQHCRGLANVRAFNIDGREVQTDYLVKPDCVMVLNDPNSIMTVAMRPGFAREIDKKSKGLRIVSTLGCNVSGIHRLPWPTRKEWLDFFAEQEAALPRRHDLMLAAFQRDSDRWAYMLSIPQGLRWINEAEADVRSAFALSDRGFRIGWLKNSPERFEQIKEWLVLTEAELKARNNPTIPFEEGP